MAPQEKCNSQEQGLLAPFYEASFALAGGAPIGAPKMLSGLTGSGGASKYLILNPNSRI